MPRKKETGSVPVEVIAEESVMQVKEVKEDEKKVVSKTTSTNMKRKVRVDFPLLNIRTGPGKDHPKTGRYTGVGTFIITKIQKGTGSESGWGKLESGEGWISLDYTKKA